MLDSLFNFSQDAGFIALFIASFLAATLLPGGSEVVLIAVIAKHPDSIFTAVAVATIGNTLGGTTSYLIGGPAVAHRWPRSRHGGTATGPASRLYTPCHSAPWPASPPRAHEPSGTSPA